jgi:hypothetical protein
MARRFGAPWRPGRLEDQQDVHGELHPPFGNPQAAAQQAFNRAKNFAYGMAFLAYSY